MGTKVKTNSKPGYKSAYNRIFKRCLDFTIALIAIIVLLAAGISVVGGKLMDKYGKKPHYHTKPHNH